MTTIPHSHQAVFQRLHEATNSHDPEAISTAVDEVFDADAVFHTAIPARASARQTVKDAWTILLRAFPDIQVTVEETITEGDRTVFRNTVTGTHQGDYRGLPPTGRRITYDEVFILRFSGGRIVEGWGIVDVFSQLRQLGAIDA